MIIRVSGSVISNPVNVNVGGDGFPSPAINLVVGSETQYNPSINLVVGGEGVPGSNGISVSVPQFVSKANFAETASYAGTSSFAFRTLGSIVSSSYTDFAAVARFSEGGSGSFTGSFIGDGSQLVNIQSSSWADATAWELVSGIPIGLVSSSTQVDYTAIQNKPTTISTASFVDYSNVANKPVGLVSASSQVDFQSVNNRPVGLVSSSAQVVTWSVASASLAAAVEFANVTSKPSLISSSAQVIFNNLNGVPTGLVSSSTQAVAWTVATASVALNVPTLPTGLVSSSVQVSYTGLSNIPVGIISSSAQVNAILDTDGVISSSAQVAYSGLTGVPVGIVSSSTQATTWTVASSSVATSASWAAVAISASWAPGVGDVITWEFVSNKPTGLVSSSAQATTWTVATASVANSVEFEDVTNRPTGLVSSSVQIIAQNTTGIGALATTGSNTFLGNQNVSGSVTASNVLVNDIAFNQTAGLTPPARGNLTWNSSEGMLEIGSGYDQVTTVINQETDYIIRNDTGGVIQLGTALRLNGATAGSGRITVDRMIADGTTREIFFVGLAKHDIASGVNGVSTYFGYIKGLDTRGTAVTAYSVGDENWSEGDSLYIHPMVAGKLTNVRPKHDIFVGIVINRHASQGVLFVRPASFGHIADDHDVDINTGSLSTGQLLVYNALTDNWENTRVLSGSYVISGTLSATDGISGSIVWDNVSNKPISLVSASIQVNYSQLSGIPTGIVSSSTQVDYTGIQNKPTTIPTASFVDYGNVFNKPIGLVSSSTQVAAWTVATASVATSASYALVAQNVLGSITSASYALTASYALSGGTGGSPFNLTVQQTGSVAGGNISVLNFTGAAISSVSVSGVTASVSISSGNAESASFATTASFAVSASWAPSTGGGSELTFETVSKNLKSWNYSLNYAGSTLSNIVYTSGSQTITKTLNYSDGILTSLVLSGDTPIGIALTKTLSYTSGSLTSISYS